MSQQFAGAFQVFQRLTLAEYVAIRQAAHNALMAGDGQLSKWIDTAIAHGAVVHDNEPEAEGWNAAVNAIAASLVSAGLLTQDRADAVFAPI